MKRLSRRTILRSGSTALMLPLLEANFSSGLAAATPKPPKRLVFLPMGYGVNAENWFPSQDRVGTDYELPPLLEPFADLKSDFSIIQHLTNRFIQSPHSGSSTFLSCFNPKQKPSLYSNSVSCDQLAAEVLGKDTRHASLAIGTSLNTRADGHGSYASWARDGKPVGLYRKMSDLYAALFGTGGTKEAIKARLAKKQSSLDLLTGNAKRLNHMVSANDRDRIDEYFTSIRNIERRLEKAQEWVDTPFPDAPMDDPAGSPVAKEAEIAFDLMHLALQSDSTRVMTYMIPTQSIMKQLGIGLNPHRMSHKGAGGLDPEAPHQRRDRAMAEHVSRFVRKLKETKEFDGSSILDHSLIAYGSALRQGHGKNHGPMLLAGHGGGGLEQGQNIVCEQSNTPVANLWLSMLRHVGVEQESFGDSTEPLSEMGFG